MDGICWGELGLLSNLRDSTNPRMSMPSVTTQTLAGGVLGAPPHWSPSKEEAHPKH